MSSRKFDRFFLLPEITLFQWSDRFGFPTPNEPRDSIQWRGHTLKQIDINEYPATAWLINANLDFASPLDQDPNDDGVSLLMEDALNLDPQMPNQENLAKVKTGAEPVHLVSMEKAQESGKRFS